MKIDDSRTCNLFNLGILARYLRAEAAEVVGYYNEILADEAFLADVNRQMADVRKTYGFAKGIFHMESIDSVDWFAFERILLYVLTRLHRPAAVLETGVYYGGNTSFILRALERNGTGKLVSIDLPDSAIRAASDGTKRHPHVGDSELYSVDLKPGFMIPVGLRDRWTFVEGDSHAMIPALEGRFDLYIHDSDHAMEFMLRELNLAHDLMQPNGIMIADDIDWSNAFHAFIIEHALYPLLLTDNGKDDLRVRTGVVDLAHPYIEMPAITGKTYAVR